MSKFLTNIQMGAAGKCPHVRQGDTVYAVRVPPKDEEFYGIDVDGITYRCVWKSKATAKKFATSLKRKINKSQTRGHYIPKASVESVTLTKHNFLTNIEYVSQAEEIIAPSIKRIEEFRKSQETGQ